MVAALPPNSEMIDAGPMASQQGTPKKAGEQLCTQHPLLIGKRYFARTARSIPALRTAARGSMKTNKVLAELPMKLIDLVSRLDTSYSYCAEICLWKEPLENIHA